MSEPPPPNPFRRGSPVRMVGHRGAAGEIPENTLPSFERALDIGVDAIEFDLQCTRDDRLVVLHDSSVDRVTGSAGDVEEMTYEELARLDAGYRFQPEGEKGFPFRGKGLRIPRLEEVLEATQDLPLIVEVKSLRAGRRLGAWLRDGPGASSARDRMMVGGFSGKALQAPRREARWSCATRDDLTWYVLLGKVGLGGLAPPDRADALMVPERWRGLLSIVTGRFVRRAHRDGLGVYVWTVNDPDRMRRLHEMGVDGMLSDFPARLKRMYEGITSNPSNEEDAP